MSGAQESPFARFIREQEGTPEPAAPVDPSPFASIIQEREAQVSPPVDDSPEGRAQRMQQDFGRMREARERFIEGQQEVSEADQATRENDAQQAIKEHVGNKQIDFDKTMTDQNIMRQLARRQNLPGQIALFKEHFPDGQLVQTRSGDLLFRESEDQPWGRVPFSVGGAFGEATKFRNIGAAAGGAAGLAAGGPLAPVTGVLGGIAGYGAGALVDYAADEWMGYPVPQGPERIKDVAGGMATEGILGGTFVAGGYLGRGGGRSIFHNFFKKAPGSEEVAQNIADEGLEELTIGQTARSPFVRQGYKQAAGASPIVEEKVRQQKLSALSRLENEVMKNGYEGASEKNLKQLAQAQKDAIMGDIPRFQNLDNPEVATLVKNNLMKYEETSGVTARKMAQSAFSESKKFLRLDTDPLLREAAEIERGVRTKGLVRDRNWDFVLDADGNPIPIEITLGKKPTPEVQAAIDKIKYLGEEIKTYKSKGSAESGIQKDKMMSAGEQIMTLREELFKLTQSDDPVTKAQGMRLLAATREMMEKNSPGGLRAVDKLAQAETFIRDREDALSMFNGLLQAKDPEKAATMFIRPGEDAIKRLAVLKEKSPDAFKSMVDGYRSKLLASAESDPQAIVRELDKFKGDKKALRAVMTEQEEQQWRDLAQKKEYWDSSQVNKLLEQRSGPVENAINLAFSGKTEEINQLVGQAGPNSPIARSIRAGVFGKVLAEGKVKDSMGRDTIDPQRLINAIEQLKEPIMQERLAKVLRPEDLKTLDVLNSYAAVLAGAGKTDSFSSLAAGALTSKLKEPLLTIQDPGKAATILYKVFNNKTVARILSEPATAKLLFEAGSGPPSHQAALLKAAGTKAIQGVLEDTPAKDRYQFGREEEPVRREGTGFFNWFGSKTLEPEVIKTGSGAYEDPEGIKAWQESGSSYGTGREAFVEGGGKATMVKGLTGGVKEIFDYIEKKPVSDLEKQDLKNYYTQAAMAANKSAVASLGFDPRVVTLEMTDKKSNMAGMYNVKRDKILSGATVYPSNIVHESIHRGLEKLKESDLLSDKETAFLNNERYDELFTRYLMMRTMGDPEKGRGELGDQQREAAVNFFKSGDNMRMAAAIEKKAQALIARQGVRAR